MYEKLSGPKAMARRIGAEHGDMLCGADAYAAARFRRQLTDDQDAAQVFLGESPELVSSPVYQDQRIDLNQ